MEFAILGPLEVRDDNETAVALGGVRERSLLAVLLLNANEVLATDRIVDELWGEQPPKTAVKTVQVYVSRVRKLLGADVIVTRPHGYVLVVGEHHIDAHRFERLRSEGSRALAAGEVGTARALLGEALALWRGAPLSDFAYEAFAQPEAARLHELRLEALEDRIEADLRTGVDAELVAELRVLSARHPLRERLRGQLMLALYRAGRQADALDVYRDARSTLVEELGLEPSRGLSELERAILVQDPTLERPRQVAAHGPAAFVGRDQELGALLTALRDAEGGRGTALLLSGEPGIGKSRLLDELVVRGRDQGVKVLRGRCWEAGGAPAYWPWVQVLRTLLRGLSAEDVEPRFGARASDLAELLPELRDSLGEIPPPRVRDPEALRFRLFDAVASVICEAAEDGPVLVVLDDVHAADESSLLLLQFLAAAIGDSRVLVLGAFRDTEVGRDHPLTQVLGELVRERRAERIALSGLRRADVAAYVQASTGADASPAVIDAVHSRSDGNALFMVETVRLLASEQLDAGDLATAVPSGVHDAVQRRLASLATTTTAALSVAAVVGREFDPATLEHLLGPAAIAAVDEAIGARMVTAAPGAPGTLRFSHALVRDALYEAMALASRRELHARVAETIERRHCADLTPHLAALAHHFHHAADAERAIAYARRAGALAASQLAYEEAARLYRVALSVLESGAGGDAAALCDVLLALGDVEARAGDEATAKRTFLRAAGAARDHGLAERLGGAALGYGGRFVWTKGRDDPYLLGLLEEAVAAMPPQDSALRARLLARLAAGPLVLQGDGSRARRFELSAEAVAIARRLDDPAVLAWTLDGRKVAIWAPDTLEERGEIIDELNALADRSGDPELMVDARICTLIKRIESAELHRFESEIAGARRVADELGQPGQRWLVGIFAPIHALLTGRLDGADQLIEDAFALGRTSVPWNARITRLRQRVVLAGLEGRPAQVVEELREAAAAETEYPSLQAALAALYAQLGDAPQCRHAFEALAAGDFAAVAFDDMWVLTMGQLAEACWFLGDSERAQLIHERLAPWAHRSMVGPIEASLGSATRALGYATWTAGDPSAAARWFVRAAEENERTGALPWAAHAQRAHGELLLAQGEPGAAHELLEQAATTYRTLGMDAWAARCAAPARPAVLAGVGRQPYIAPT